MKFELRGLSREAPEGSKVGQPFLTKITVYYLISKKVMNLLLPVKKVFYFLANHHKIELLVLVVSFAIFISSTYFTFHIYDLYQQTKVLIAQGDDSLKSEDFDQAFKSYNQAKGIFPNNIAARSRLDLAKKLQESHSHFVAGTQLYNRGLFAKALTEFKLVDSRDTSYPFVNVLEKETQNQQKREKEALSAFDDFYNQSVHAFSSGDYTKLLDLSTKALALTSEPFSFDKTKVEDLKQKRTQSQNFLLDQKAQKEALRNAFQLRVPILMYHYIRLNPDPNDKLGFNLSVTPTDFDSQMQYLASNGYNSVDVATLVNALKNKTSLPIKTVVITFDDGYRDFYTTAFPILKKYNLHAESYVISGFVEGRDYMTWAMLKEVQSSGLVTIGSHTINHYYLTSLNTPSLITELNQSKAQIEKT